jgi:hypothetical protein
VNDGALLFLQHMLAKMRPFGVPPSGGSGGPAKAGTPNDGSRLAIVFNGSPLFTGDAGGGESEIRRWIIENDWLEAIVALPEQLFYNTGISTYIWVLINRKEKPRKGKVQLIDARTFWVQMEKSLGNKRRRIGDPSDKEKDPAVRQQEIEAGQQRQEQIRDFLRTLGKKLWKDREAFLTHLRKSASSAVKDPRLSAPELKAVLAALGERDDTAEICRDRDGQPSGVEWLGDVPEHWERSTATRLRPKAQGWPEERGPTLGNERPIGASTPTGLWPVAATVRGGAYAAFCVNNRERRDAAGGAIINDGRTPPLRSLGISVW